MDEKEFRQGISDGANVIYQCRERGMTCKIATDGTGELITIVETISRDRTLLAPLIIYKGVAHFIE